MNRGEILESLLTQFLTHQTVMVLLKIGTNSPRRILRHNMLVYPPTVGAPVLSLESETSVVILPVHENGMHRDFRTYSYIDFEAVPNIGLAFPWSQSGDGGCTLSLRNNQIGKDPVEVGAPGVGYTSFLGINGNRHTYTVVMGSESSCISYRVSSGHIN